MTVYAILLASSYKSAKMYEAFNTRCHAAAWEQKHPNSTNTINKVDELLLQTVLLPSAQVDFKHIRLIFLCFSLESTGTTTHMQPTNPYGVETNLRRLRILLCPTDEAIFIGLSLAGEAVDLGVRSQRAFIVNVTAANSADTPCVHWLTAVLYFGHGSEEASWLARLANVSKLVDSPKSKLLLSICCRIKQQRRHDFPTRL